MVCGKCGHAMDECACAVYPIKYPGMEKQGVTKMDLEKGLIKEGILNKSSGMKEEDYKCQHGEAKLCPICTLIGKPVSDVGTTSEK